MQVDSFEDPWLPLDRAYGDLPGPLAPDATAPISALVRWAGRAMVALAALRRDKRELFARTAKLTDRVSNLEAYPQPNVEAAIRTLNTGLGAAFRDETLRLHQNDRSLATALDTLTRRVDTIQALVEDHLRDEDGKDNPEQEPAWSQIIRTPHSASSTLVAAEGLDATVASLADDALVVHLRDVASVTETAHRSGATGMRISRGPVCQVDKRPGGSVYVDWITEIQAETRPDGR